MSTHKFLYLFEKLSKNLFKEQRFVYAETPPNSDEKAAQEAERTEIKEQTAEERNNLGTVIAKETETGDGIKLKKPTESEQLEIDLRDDNLNQTNFDKIIDKNIKDLTKEQVEKLATYAKTNEPEKNIKKLFDQYTDGKLTVEQMTVKTVKIFISKVTNKTDIDPLINGLIKTEAKANILIKAAEEDKALLKQIFEAIEDNVLKNISGKSIAILADKLEEPDFKKLLSKISNEQKGLLLNTSIDSNKKEETLNTILKGVKSLAELDEVSRHILINYLCSNKDIEGLNKTLNDKMLDDAACTKLSKESVQLLLNKTYSEDESNAIYKKVLEKADSKVKAELAKDKTLYFSEKTRNSLAKIEAEKAPEPEVRPAETPNKSASRRDPEKAPAPETEAKAKDEKKDKTAEETKPKIEKFTDEMSIPDILKASGFELNGKSIKWTFKIPNGKNDPIESERSILNTKKFQKILNEQDESDRFKIDTPDKLRLCVYKYLWKNIYKGGTVKNKYKKANFEESQKFLQAEITRLEATTKDKPADVDPKTSGTEEPAKEPKATEVIPLRKRIEENIKKGQTLEAADAKDTAPKAPKYKDHKEATEAFDNRTNKRLEEIRKIASKTAVDRNITIVGPVNPKTGDSSRFYDISIDNKPTKFRLEMYRDLNSDKVEFRFKKPSEYTAFAEYSDKKVAEEFADMLDKIPNDREVKDFDAAIKAAEKGAKIEIKEPKKLTLNQLKVLENSRDGIINSVKNGENLFDTLESMKKFAKEGQSVLSASPITKVTFDTTPAIVWDVQNKDAPFGKEETLKTSILAIKEKEFGGKDTDAYKKFIENTSTKETEDVSKADELARTKEYRQKYGELTDKNFTLKIGSLSRDEMVEKWSNMGGHVKVDKIMSHPPFSLNADGETAKVAADTISEWFNDKVDFADVFKLVKDVPKIKTMGLTPLIEEGPGEFMKVFNKLLKDQEAGRLTNKTLQDQLEVMFTKVIVPCLELLNAFEELQMPKETKEKEKEEEPQGEQKEIMDALKKLCNFNDTKNSGWSEFLASAYGGKSELTMSDINGKTFTINKGQFHNNYDPKAALAILLNINEDKNNDNAPDHYSFNDKDKKVLNKDAMLGEINNRIKLGVTNMVMAEAGQEDSKLAKAMAEAEKEFKEYSKIDKNLENGFAAEILKEEIKSRLANYTVKDFKNITPEQIKAFQIGFVIGQASKFAEKIAESKQALAESSDNPTIRNHPYFKQLASSLLDQGIEPGKVKKIQEKVLLAAGASFKNGKFEGGGAGLKFDIGDGTSVGIGIGAIIDKGLVGGVGVSVDVYRSNGVVVSVGVEIGICGVTAGSSQTIDAGKVKLHAFEGFHWSWDSIIPTTGGGLGISWNMENQLKEDLAAAEEKTDYSKVWNEWKNINKYDIDAKYVKLAQIPRLWRPIEAIQKEFGLSNADVVNIVEGIKEQLTDKVMKNLSSPIPLFSYAGFALLGPIPVPQVGFKLGSASISIPNRRAISKILTELSDVTVTNALKKAIAELDKGDQIPRFVEQTGKLIYSRDGKLMNLVESKTIDFSQFPQSGIEAQNKELKRAEMKLTKNENGTTGLKVLGPEMKDIEIHIDPNLKELGIVKDGANILIEGNTDDLIISRERFEFPFGRTKGSASIRDVITIRQTGSLRGNRDSTWIQTYESAFLQKLESEAEFSMQTGNNDKHPQKNLLEIAGYSTKAAAEIGKLEAMKAFIDKRPNMEGRLDAKQIEELGKAAQERREAMEQRGVAMKIKEYEKLQVRNNLFDDLTKSFPKKNEFTKEFQSNIDTPEELVKTLKNFSDQIGLPKLNEKERNLAITHLTNLHYTNVYKEATSKKADGNENLSTSEIRKINQSIAKGMEKKIDWVKKEVLMPKFKRTLEEIKPSLGFSAEQLVNKLINDTFNPLREKLNDPDFDFRKIQVELIPGGAYLFSGSRQYEKGKREGALSQNINYETLPKDKQLLLGFGLLKGTTGSYELNKGTPEEKALARVILEISSPIPKEDIEFLESPLALKFAGLNSGVLLCFNEGNKFDDYAKITEVYKNPTLLQSSPAHKEAVGRFRTLINEVRACQLDGKTFEKKIGNTGLTVKIKMSTEIKRGAYSKCTNPSFYAQESAEVSIYAKNNKVIAQFNTSNEVIDAEASKLFASFGLGIGFRNEKVVTPAKPQVQDGGGTDGGTGGDPKNGARPSPDAGTGNSTGGGTGGDSGGGAGQARQESSSSGAGE